MHVDWNILKLKINTKIFAFILPLCLNKALILVKTYISDQNHLDC